MFSINFGCKAFCSAKQLMRTTAVVLPGTVWCGRKVSAFSVTATATLVGDEILN